MVYNSRTKKLIEIAYMYYIDGLSQNQISDKMSISRSNVSVMLNEARLKNIVQIRIKNSELFCFNLERTLEKTFGLKRAIVIPNWSEHFQNQDVRVQLADATADYLLQIINDNMTIGVSWGKIISELADRIDVDNFSNLVITPLLGSIGINSNLFHSNYIAIKMAKKFNTYSLLLNCPNFLSTESLKDSIFSDKNIETVLKKSASADIAIVQINNIENILDNTLDCFSQDILSELNSKGAVGEFNSWFFNSSGNLIPIDLNSKNIAIEYEHFKKIPTVIGVNGGIKNTEAIHAILKNSLIDVLVTDEKVANKILSNY